jgi:hypothetical protein
MFAFAQLSENTGFFAEFFEPSDRALDRFVLSDSNSSHKITSPPINRTVLFPRLILTDFPSKSSN